jgi:hypothetical protein
VQELFWNSYSSGTKPTAKDFAKLRQDSLEYKELFTKLYTKPKAADGIFSKELAAKSRLDFLEDTLYPLSRTAFPGGVQQLYQSFKGRGIVMTSGSHHYRYQTVIFE